MKKLTSADAMTRSADLLAANVAQLRELFPEAVKEGKIDFEVLKELLGGEVDEREEKFGLSWHGKRQARRLALTPSSGTLRPCPEESVDWDKTQNIMIEGDNLEVLKLLQKSYSGKVKLIYIDPPYNTGKDFVYPDDYQDSIKNYLMRTGQVDSDGRDNTSNAESSGRFHTDWLNMIYPRLRLARNLLRPDGMICITIDDNEVGDLRSVCDEIFGEENFLGIVVWQHSVQPKGYPGKFSVHHNFVFCYQKSGDFELASLERTDEHNKNYANPDKDPRGSWRAGDVRNANYRPNLIYKIKTPSGKFIDPPENGWRWSKETVAAKIQSGEIVFSSDQTRIIRKIYLDTLDGRTPETILFGKDVGTTRDAAAEIKKLFDGIVPFDTPKPTGLIKYLISLAGASGDDVVLDFFAGSGTSGDAVWQHNAIHQHNLRAVLVQLPEVLDVSKPEQKDAAECCDEIGRPRNIAELTKERLRRAAKKIKAENLSLASDLGFRVFKLDSSNIHAWEPDRTNLAESVQFSIDHLKTDRSEQDILFELLLKLGLDLTVPIETRTIAEKAVHSIGAGTLVACLATAISAAEVEELADGIVKWHKELAPTGEVTAVFRDSAFANDVAKTNLSAILVQNGITGVRSL